MFGGGGQEVIYNDPNVRPGGERPGDAFVGVAGYRAIRDSGARSSQWSSGPVEVKATLFEGDLDTPGGGRRARPARRPRPASMPVLFQPLTVASLLATAPTSSNRVRVIVETVAADDAQTVAEGAAKPEATLEFEETDEPVRKIAAFLPVSDEMLSDAPAIRGYLNSRLACSSRTRRSTSCSTATAPGTDLDGLLNRIPAENEGIVSDAVAANAADHIYAAIVQVQASFLDADGDRRQPGGLGRPAAAQGSERGLHRWLPF